MSSIDALLLENALLIIAVREARLSLAKAFGDGDGEKISRPEAQRPKEGREEEEERGLSSPFLGLRVFGRDTSASLATVAPAEVLPTAWVEAREVVEQHSGRLRKFFRST